MVKSGKKCFEPIIITNKIIESSNIKFWPNKYILCVDAFILVVNYIFISFCKKSNENKERIYRPIRYNDQQIFSSYLVNALKYNNI